jgi:hypothetical protein
MRASLFVNNAIVGKIISDESHGHYTQATTRAVVHMESGQRAFVRNVEGNEDLFTNTQEPYTTFTGVLVKAD